MNVLTCVYCGMAYPEGTSPHGSAVLTAHIKVCDKHPMRELEEKYRKVRAALVGLVECDNVEELKAMEAAMDLMPDTVGAKSAAKIAVQALIENR